jgi:hypothetical protein
MKSLTIVAMLLIASVAGAQTTKPTTMPAKPGADAPSPDQLLNSMLKPPANSGRVIQPLPDSPKIDAGSGKAVAPNAPAVKLLREGSPIVDRVGRLTKSADGQQWELAFEADGKTMQDPPLIILPNLNLAAMESAVSGASRDLKFRVTGTVTEYKGRNYILLEKVVVPPEAAQQF